ncbi:MAG: DUF1223 domain-containing protein [Candidatus Omnitrophota bacterium]
MRKLFGRATLLVLASFFLAAGAFCLEFESKNRQASLLELYSSEGCSSCPPADEWVSALKDHPGLWTEVVPVIFHVDYWDYLGWKDRFASYDFTERQKRHIARVDKRGHLYTPYFVVDGNEWRDWYRYDSFPTFAMAGTGVLKVDIPNFKDNRYEIVFRPGSKRKRALEIHGAILGFGVTSEVKAGENRGRTLRHDFIVLNYQKSGMARANGEYSGSLTLEIPAAFQAERFGFAVWVTEEGETAPVQATGGYILW